MKYQNKATPIRTVAEYEAARTAGARFEFTRCGCDYDLPSRAAGWINTYWPERVARSIERGDDPDQRLRAFYPERIE